MRKVVKFIIVFHLLSFVSAAAFSFLVQLFFVGTIIGIPLLILSIYSAYVITFEERATIKQVAGFTAIVYIIAIMIDWLVENSFIPNVTSWSGLAIHIILGILSLVVAFFAVARGGPVMRHLISDA